MTMHRCCCYYCLVNAEHWTTESLSSLSSKPDVLCSPTASYWWNMHQSTLAKVVWGKFVTFNKGPTSDGLNWSVSSTFSLQCNFHIYNRLCTHEFRLKFLIWWNILDWRSPAKVGWSPTHTKMLLISLEEWQPLHLCYYLTFLFHITQMLRQFPTPFCNKQSISRPIAP